MKTTKPRVVAVVVAWNRQDLMIQTLDGLACQTRAPEAVVVIDNASTDNSRTIAKEHEAVDEVLTMPENLGGAGGFAAGIARAVNHWNADLVWIMDDDTVPTQTALAGLLEARRRYPGQPALLASKAIWTDGREHPMNRPRPRPLLDPELARRAEEIDAIPIRTASFVSIMIDRRAIEEDGLPKADYFLWNDDFEYTARLLRHRVGLYVPYSVVVHKTKKFGDSSADPGPRFVNEVRNKLWMYTRSNALNPVEKALYGGKSVLRWGMTVKNSADPKALLGFAREGIKQGTKPPRTTAEVLSHTPVARDVEALEGAGHQVFAGENEPFTVLTSVYAGDNPQQFERALVSITREQELKPDQVVLVQDGPVPDELQETIDRASDIAGQHIDVVRLVENQGLALALEAGLKAAKHEIIARADADDVSLPQRFAKQLPLMRGRDLIGSAIAEFEHDETQWGMIRVLPVKHQDIAKTARFRDPFNHPTVVMRKSALERAGGYQHLDRMEDYWLFARMIASGARTANIEEPLVAYRVGAGAYARRGGSDLFDSELELQRNLLRIGFVTPAQYVRNVVIRAGYRLIPTAVRKFLYQGVGTLSWFRRG
ncbi:glycosyltransferase [Actinomyces urinae]|uniref:glycosyltransferase n=1 Tax=Actinomyces urinae TaxID=1689268 RepID=UPI00093033D3|nr:glycosyltransferase [Actinomyces urinae]